MIMAEANTAKILAQEIITGRTQDGITGITEIITTATNSIRKDIKEDSFKNSLILSFWRGINGRLSPGIT